MLTCTLLAQVLPGSSLLAEMDDELAKSDYRYFDSVNKLGAFSKLCKSLEDRYNLDYIIVDLSPGTTALNRTVIMRCATGPKPTLRRKPNWAALGALLQLGRCAHGWLGLVTCVVVVAEDFCRLHNSMSMLALASLPALQLRLPAVPSGGRFL
jgi:hypothetical protein